MTTKLLCSRCQAEYDDAQQWTICPHRSRPRRLQGMNSLVTWVDASIRQPQAPGKYVVEIVVGEMCYLSTRSYNPFPVAEHQGWLNMGPGELVSHWLENLTSVTEFYAKAAG